MVALHVAQKFLALLGVPQSEIVWETLYCNNNFYFYLEANTYAQLQFDIVEIAPIFFLNKRCLFEEIEFLEDYLITF